MHHHCLYAATTWTYNKAGPHQIIPYCLSESTSKWKIEKNNCDQKFTFGELKIRNISSQQLYLWSAPIDLIERYQFYLNSCETNMERELFYNCTFPWFGPMCQYELEISRYDNGKHKSFQDIPGRALRRS